MIHTSSLKKHNVATVELAVVKEVDKYLLIQTYISVI